MKTEHKVGIILFVVYCVVICFLVIFQDDIFFFFSTKHSDFPPGYTIVCDVNTKQLGVKMPDSNYVIDKDYDNKPFKDRQHAIERAWGQYNYKPEPEEKHTWRECK